MNVVDRVALHNAATGPVLEVDAAFAADNADAATIHVVNTVVGDPEGRNVPVDREGLTRGWLRVVNLVVIENQVGNRLGDRSAVHRDAHGVRAADFVDDVVADLDVRPAAENANRRPIEDAG